MPSRSFLVIALFLLSGVAACAAKVGDGCLNNADCAFGQTCDTSPPGGYCLIVGCRANSCPSEAWCASFQVGARIQSFCLRKCGDDGDCRDGYRCRFDTGAPGGVCYTAAPTPDGGP
jgi:hypothetical protein